MPYNHRHPDWHNTYFHSTLSFILTAEREEIELRLDHLVKRCLGVEIEVQIIRNQSQQLAMERVTEILESLVDSAHSDLRRTKTVAQRFVCHSYCYSS